MDKGVKYDQEKPRLDLIPPLAELQVAKVLTFGALKYSPDNWRKVEDAKQRYIAAALRHINAYRSGEMDDSESGINHIAHAITGLLFVLELDEEDDYD